VHTCIRTSKAEEVLQDNVCTSVCTPLAYDDHGDQEDSVCKPHAYGHAYGHAPEKQEEASSVCTYASYASTPKGNTGVDGDPFAVLKDPKWRLQLNDDDPLLRVSYTSDFTIVACLTSFNGSSGPFGGSKALMAS